MIIGLSEAANQSAKFLKRMTQEQVDQLACIAPKCDLAHNRWGDCSLWVVSVANRALKAGQFTVDQILQFKDEIGLDLQAFTEYKAELGGNIDAFKSYKDLHHAVAKYIEGGRVVPKVSGAQMSNRARTAYHRMKAEGFDAVYEDRTWLVASPTGFDANETMSPIGKWCHTGAVGGNGLKYWNDYSIGPIYYILNKREGYVLCHSYAASYEIEDQTDKRPYRLEAGSNVWGFNSGKEQSDRPPKAVPYGDSEADWNDFMDYIDPAGNVKAAILKYERGYEQTLRKRLKAAVENEMIAPLEKSIDGGVLTLNSGNVQAFYRLLHKADVDFPDEDDYEDEDDYNTDYEAA